MYRVLLPIDTDEDRARSQANYVTKLPNAGEDVEAILLFVFTEDQGEIPSDIRPLKSVTRIKSVQVLKDVLEDEGIKTTLLEHSGQADTDIIDAAEEYDVDSIIMGGRKRSPVGKVIFGSVTQSVILNSQRPVVVTGGHQA